LVSFETGAARTQPGERRYQAFLVAPDGKGRARVQAFDLGPAAAIEEAAQSWRQVLRTGQLPPGVEPAPEQRLRRLAWEPIRRRDGKPWARCREADLVHGIAGRFSAADVLQGGGACVRRVADPMTRANWIHLAAPGVAPEQTPWPGEARRSRTLGMTGLPQPA